MERLVCLVVGYLFGMFQTGYIYGKTKGIDIRQHGSGNAGSTNVLRTMGIKAGAITFLGDCLKCVAAVLVARGIFAEQTEILPLFAMYAGFGAVLGHNYPFYLKFRGGKGIAVTAAMIIMTDLRLAALCLVVFVVIVAVTRFVSLGSLVVSTLFLVGLIFDGQMGRFGVSQSVLFEMYGIGVLFVISAFFKHKANIIRLQKGTENKIFAKKEDDKSSEQKEKNNG